MPPPISPTPVVRVSRYLSKHVSEKVNTSEKQNSKELLNAIRRRTKHKPRKKKPTDETKQHVDIDIHALVYRLLSNRYLTFMHMYPREICWFSALHGRMPLLFCGFTIGNDE